VRFSETDKLFLQEVLNRCSKTGSKLRQEVYRITGVAKEADFCSCLKPSKGCTSCLRQRVVNLLTQKGFVAALCTSKWNNTKKYPGGDHNSILLCLIKWIY
jgi:hypothetical protein